MDAQLVLLTSCLLVLILVTVALAAYSACFLWRNWNDVKSTKPIWRNKYPSFEELHALFDRGDVMLSAVLIASSIQLSHPELFKVLKAHSTYKTDPWRRIIRTMAFIYIMIRSNSSERQQVITWLQKLHSTIPMFVFENNVLVFATFAYGLVKTHELLGNITPEQVDGVVKGVMSMADKLDPKDWGRKVPSTMLEVEEYLKNELSFDADELRNILNENSKLCSIQKDMKKQGAAKFLKMPWTTFRLLIFRKFVWALSDSVLAQEDHSQSILGRPFWWCVRKLHCFFSYFHYTMCPQTLTFDGTLDLLVTGNPGMGNVLADLYREIFGSKDDVALPDLPNKGLRRFSDMQAHLPRMDIDERPLPAVVGFCEEVTELVKCSYYRGMLVRSIGHPPRHLGVIMDGNRRYSRHMGLKSVLAGHQVGAHKLLQVMSWAFSSEVRNLTVWALSDDNLKRGPQELNPLFSMMAEYIREMMMGDAPFSIPQVRFRVVGDRSMLPDYLNDLIVAAEAATAQNTKFNLQIAIGYGGRSEVTRATKLAVNVKVTQEGMSLEEAIETITEADISRQTYSAQLGLPHIDAILRTSGENRLSGFALWESHHAEFAIVEENWPALRQSTFLRSLLDLSHRNRRLGA
ncbi:putative undecaprenyl diphosphate synthase-domain-containing protein [Thelonectria olida]|uniref:Undecaprenyl diphosphate synthase-domain-containing protein n=1 Tax=Thelonectria olida TaxID=1576542 RepID=A0A9P8W3V6_9HYPO|nr:putative undecaprenyl diphosphate synthase-domain-containing protein [Thelonectria olida]